MDRREQGDQPEVGAETSNRTAKIRRWWRVRNATGATRNRRNGTTPSRSSSATAARRSSACSTRRPSRPRTGSKEHQPVERFGSRSELHRARAGPRRPRQAARRRSRRDRGGSGCGDGPDCLRHGQEQTAVRIHANSTATRSTWRRPPSHHREHGDGERVARDRCGPATIPTAAPTRAMTPHQRYRARAGSEWPCRPMRRSTVPTAVLNRADEAGEGDADDEPRHDAPDDCVLLDVRLAVGLSRRCRVVEDIEGGPRSRSRTGSGRCRSGPAP